MSRGLKLVQDMYNIMLWPSRQELLSRIANRPYMATLWIIETGK